MIHGCAHHLTLELASVTLVFEVPQKLKIRLTNLLMAYALILPMTYVRCTVYGRWYISAPGFLRQNTTV